MRFFNGHESFRCVTLWHFDDLKISYPKFPGTLASRFRGYRWSHILHFGGLKLRILEGFETVSPLVKTFSLRFDSLKMRFRKGHVY
jgi:hypothetical protein